MPLRASSHPGIPNSPSCSALAWFSCWPGLSPWGSGTHFREEITVGDALVIFAIHISTILPTRNTKLCAFLQNAYDVFTTISLYDWGWPFDNIQKRYLLSYLLLTQTDVVLFTKCTIQPAFFTALSIFGIYMYWSSYDDVELYHYMGDNGRNEKADTVEACV